MTERNRLNFSGHGWKNAVCGDAKLPHLIYENTAGSCSRTKRTAVFRTGHRGYLHQMSVFMGQYPDKRCSDHVLLLVCNSLTCPGIAPGIPYKNRYHFQGKGGMGGLGKSGSGKKNRVPALPATAALLIFRMFLALVITVSPLNNPALITLRVNYD